MGFDATRCFSRAQRSIRRLHAAWRAAISSLAIASAVLLGPKIGRSALIFGAIGAPAAWFGQRVFGEAVIDYVCIGNADGGLLRPDPGWAISALVAIESTAFLIAVAGGLVSFWAITFGRDPLGGDDRQSAIDAGKVRRVLRLGGLMMAGCFTTIIAFDALFLVTTPLCAP